MVDQMHPDRVLDEYAARQYGAFSLEQARAAGHTPKMVHNRVEKGAWIRLAPSIYALASAPPKWERQMAAALLSRSGSIAGGRSAAYLHGFDGFGRSRPVIIVPETANARSPLARVIRSNRFDALGRVRRNGFVVTDEAETIVTLARDLGAEAWRGWSIPSLPAGPALSRRSPRSSTRARRCPASASCDVSSPTALQMPISRQ